MELNYWRAGFYKACMNKATENMGLRMSTETKRPKRMTFTVSPELLQQINAYQAAEIVKREGKVISRNDTLIKLVTLGLHQGN